MKYQMLAAHKHFDDDSNNRDSVDEKQERKWSIKNNGKQNEDHVMERRACCTIILKFSLFVKGRETF